MADQIVAEHGEVVAAAQAPCDLPAPGPLAFRVLDDSMRPVARRGQFVLAEEVGPCVPGEYVMLGLTDGRKTVLKLVAENADAVVVETVNDECRTTIMKAQVERMLPVVAIATSRLDCG